jgi:cytochrome bd ubiquinol oxidase subunit I
MTLGLTALELARIQFAFTVSFHIIFPAISIGLASFLAILEWRWLKTQNPIFQDLFKFWVKIFAVAFGMGVVSGVVMSYQFGTNWSEFSRVAGSVTGPDWLSPALSVLGAAHPELRGLVLPSAWP